MTGPPSSGGARPTLGALKPRRTTRDWVLRFVVATAAVTVLWWSLRASEVRLLGPRDLQNAREFVLGRELTDRERADARRVADAQLMISLERRARDRIEASPRDESLERAELHALAARAAADVRASMTDEEYEAAIAGRLAEALALRRGGFFPPETRPHKIFGDRLFGPEPDDASQGYIDLLLETIAMALLGTLLAVGVSVPASLLGAHRSLAVLLPGARAAWLRRALLFTMRRSFDVCRGFNEYVMALIFVALVGLGPFAGMLALFVHTYGVLSKVVSDAVETADVKPIEGVTSTGAHGVQVVSYAVLPQVAPFIVSQSLLRFETNVRSATILGVVGAGGIGQLLEEKITSNALGEVATMMVIIIATVTLIDMLCQRLMSRFT